MRVATLLLVVSLVWPPVCEAQENRGWWRQLFKPACPIEEDKAADHALPQDEVLPLEGVESVTPGLGLDSSGGPDSADSERSVDGSQGVHGSVTWEIPAEILALDSGRPEPKDIRIPGFRVQLFMGKLDSARQLKRTLEEKELVDPIYVTPYPPLFGVTVGNFTTSLAAHRVREAWRPRFPNALVVPLDLPLDAVFPPGNSPAHGPQLPPTHRD